MFEAHTPTTFADVRIYDPFLKWTSFLIVGYGEKIGKVTSLYSWLEIGSITKISFLVG